jgi:predicted ribosome quality control (RQC) complex YloA/Tae2 family protein
MTDDGDGPSDARRPEREAEASRVARESMLARHKLIEAMIDNNMRQLKFDSARCGADIERACALRDIERGADDREPTERLAEVERRIERLEEEHRSLVAEREWLNRSLLEFDEQATANRKFLI